MIWLIICYLKLQGAKKGPNPAKKDKDVGYECTQRP